MAPLRRGWLLAWLTCIGAVKMQTQLHLNPIRKVVTLLQMMQKTVTENGEHDKQLFDAAMCSCRKSEGDIGQSISDAEDKAPKLESDAEAGGAEKTQLTSDLTQAQEGKAAAQKTLEEAKAIRTKEAGDYAKQSAEDKVNLAAMKEALVALKAGSSASFLQTSGVDVIRRFAQNQDLPDWDKRTLTSFLSSSQSGEDSQGDSSDEADSGDIIGIISQIEETLVKDSAESAAAERKGADDYDALVLSKGKEMSAINKELETKTARLGDVDVELVNVANDLSDTNKGLAKDKASLEQLTKACTRKKNQFDQISQTRSEELSALSDTIEILSNDDATHLFKNSLPTTSLLQMQMSSRQLLKDARQELAKSAGRGPRDPRMDLINMAMRGRKVNFGQVLNMIDKMIALLGKEDKDEKDKVSYCNSELDEAGDEKTSLENTISDTTKTVANSKELLGTVKTDIIKLTAEIQALDQAVKESTAQRKDQNAAFIDELGSNNAAVEILTVAKKRLDQFFTPVPEKVLEKRQGAAAGASALQNAFSFMQVHQKEQSRILEMIDMLVKDLKKQAVEMKSEEESAQTEYQQFMRDCSEKHAAAAKALSGKESVKAEREVSIQKHGKELKTATAEAMANAEFLQSLHKECDWLLKNAAVKSSARASEIDSLQKAKAVLSGSDFSFLQVQKEIKRNLRSISHH